MTPERWARIQEIFLRAAELHGDERARFLETECAGDPSLLAQVQGMLAGDEQSDGLLTKPIENAAAGVAAARDPVAGDTIGPYVIRDQLGRGGMGAVYLGERADDQFRQKVAIKVIRLGMGSDEILLRFRAERQILANLNHANIARLIDGGVSLHGQPYLVMDHVDGEPLDRYCSANRLPLRERILLFRQICDAVQYAHRNLVVHRDLKPANILVTADGT